MDPISQAALGAAVPQSVSSPERLLHCTWIGALAGMAPDLDVLIRSDTDPLLFLEFHRQFTHSLIFIPLGALLCTGVFWPLVRHRLSFAAVWWVSLLGYGTHGLLDACTTYGTLLLWPFSYQRVAWNSVSVVDPLFTLPLLILVVTAVVKKQPVFARAGVAWALLYLAFGWLQSERAEQVGRALADSRGHVPARLDAKPGFANIFLWKVVYEYDGRFYVDAVRVGVTAKVFTGSSVPKLQPQQQLPWLSAQSQQALDIDRFKWFSNDYLALDAGDPNLIVDMRYSMLPNEIEGLWGIRVNPQADTDEHVTFVTRREPDSARLQRLVDMLVR